MTKWTRRWKVVHRLARRAAARLGVTAGRGAVAAGVALAVIATVGAVPGLPGHAPSPWQQATIDVARIAGSGVQRPTIDTFIAMGMLLDELLELASPSRELASSLADDRSSVRRALAPHGFEHLADATYWAMQGAAAFRAAAAETGPDPIRHLRASYPDALARTAVQYRSLAPDGAAARRAIDALLASRDGWGL